jgi:hypothetical protein
MTPITRVFVAVVLGSVLPSGVPAESFDAAGPLAGCPAGTYRFLVAGDPQLRELDIRDGNAALVPGCRPSKAQLTVGDRGAGVVAEWPSCEGAKTGVQLEGRIHGVFCERFDGTVTFGKGKPRDVHAQLVSCRAQYPDDGERKSTVARAVSSCLTEFGGDPWKDAQDFARLYYGVQAKLGCDLEN